MRRLSLLFAVLFVVLLFGSDSPRDYDDKVEVVGIEGVWKHIQYELNGEKVSFPYVMTFHNGTYSVDGSDGESYHIDFTKKPHHLDQTRSQEPFKGIIKGIYQVDGDTLRIAHLQGEADIRRPQGFNGDGVIVATYKRVK
jgi:uncharacterized protein (TIGR03067 family)